ncbi:MAG: hypothetical protein MUC84_09485, partial [Solirubrobacteraceae bacterium]|nr:hypothetical protein [Solirubrobacteraceae bacterium]
MSAAPIRLVLAGVLAALGLGTLATSAQAVCLKPEVLITAPATPTVPNDRTSVRGVIDVTATITSDSPLTAASAAITPQGGSPSPVL